MLSARALTAPGSGRVMRPRTAAADTPDTMNATRSIEVMAVVMQRLPTVAGWSQLPLATYCCAAGEVRLNVKGISIDVVFVVVLTVKTRPVLLPGFRKRRRRPFREAEHFHWFAEGFLHRRLPSCGNDVPKRVHLATGSESRRGGMHQGVSPSDACNKKLNHRARVQ